MGEICPDNRFELIERYKKKLIEGTNIKSDPEEMKVLDKIMFRFWQMGWLDHLEEKEEWTPITVKYPEDCSKVLCLTDKGTTYRAFFIIHGKDYEFCPEDEQIKDSEIFDGKIIAWKLL